MMARDVFSLAHFPMLCGVIACAAVVEQAVAHPAGPLSPGWRIALAVGLVLFVGGAAGAVWRANGRLLQPRFAIIGGTALAIVSVPGAPPLISLAIAFAGLAAVAVVEEKTPRDVRRQA